MNTLEKSVKNRPSLREWLFLILLTQHKDTNPKGSQFIGVKVHLESCQHLLVRPIFENKTETKTKIKTEGHMGHQDQDGEKVGQTSLFFWKSEAAMDREKQKFIHFQVLLSNLS